MLVLGRRLAMMLEVGLVHGAGGETTALDTGLAIVSAGAGVVRLETGLAMMPVFLMEDLEVCKSSIK